MCNIILFFKEKNGLAVSHTVNNHHSQQWPEVRKRSRIDANLY